MPPPPRPISYNARLSNDRKFHAICPRLLALSLCGCGSAPFLYKTDVVQGNVFSDDEIARIQPGMSRAEVERILGTPQLVDPFHKDRANYLYRYFAGDSKRTYSRRLVVYYSAADTVAHVEQQNITATK